MSMEDLVGSIKPNSNRFKEQMKKEEAKKQPPAESVPGERDLGIGTAKIGSTHGGSTSVVEDSFLKKFRKNFISDNIQGAYEEFVDTKVIPEIIDFVLDLVNDGLSMIFKTRRRGGSKGGSKTDYASISSGSRYYYSGSSGYYSSSSEPSTKSSVSGRAGSPKSILFKIGPDEMPRDAEIRAKEALSTVNDVLDEYPTISVGELYEICDVPQRGFTDHDYGWDQKLFSLAKIERAREGYILQLPAPIPIK